MLTLYNGYIRDLRHRNCTKDMSRRGQLRVGHSHTGVSRNFEGYIMQYVNKMQGKEMEKLLNVD